MLKLENVSVMNIENAIRGLRNPLQSWDKSDSFGVVDCNKCGRVEREGFCVSKEHDCTEFKGFHIGKNDFNLMKNLIFAGSDHRKFLRQIFVSVDITAPLYWWKEYDTYKVGTVTNSTSTMHTIHKKDFTINDFSIEHLNDNSLDLLTDVIITLNYFRQKYVTYNHKDYWWQMIQLLPSSYNQMRTCTLNYEVLFNIYNSRKNHKLYEWNILCDWIETLPIFDKILCDVNK